MQCFDFKLVFSLLAQQIEIRRSFFGFYVNQIAEREINMGFKILRNEEPLTRNLSWCQKASVVTTKSESFEELTIELFVM